MLQFWITISLMLILAALFVLLPFWLRAKKINLTNLITSSILIIFIIIFSLIFYFKTGASIQLRQFYVEKSHAALVNAEIANFKSPHQLIEKMLTVLQQHPDSAQGWFLLGRLYLGTNQLIKAGQAFEQAIKLDPSNLTYKLQYVQTDFFAHHRNLSSAAASYLNEISKAEPKNLSVINLLALNAYSHHNFQQAINEWELLLNDFPANTENGQIIMNAITTAQRKLTKNSSDATTSPKIIVRVHIDKILLNSLPATTTVFIYAKAATGLPMPIAIQRYQLKDLPKIIYLTDADAMVAQHTLSNVKEVYVTARISKSGAAMPQPGDISVQSPVIKLSKISKVTVNLILKNNIIN